MASKAWQFRIKTSRPRQPQSYVARDYELKPIWKAATAKDACPKQDRPTLLLSRNGPGQQALNAFRSGDATLELIAKGLTG